MDDLFSLSEIFENNMDFVEAESSVKKEGDIVTLSGGGHFTMNETAFNAVKEKVTEIRTKITQK